MKAAQWHERPFVYRLRCRPRRRRDEEAQNERAEKAMGVRVSPTFQDKKDDEIGARFDSQWLSSRCNRQV